MLTITIDNKTIAVEKGTTVLGAAERLGIAIPTLCHHPDLRPVGSCRICLVHVAGMRRPEPSCSLLVTNDMVITTQTDDIASERRSILEMLLAEYHDDDVSQQAAASGELRSNRKPTEFLQLVESLKADWPLQPNSQPRHQVDADPNPFIRIDLNQCILCTRCVRACDEIQGRFVWNIAGRGDSAKVICGNDTSMLEARCESCGACAEYCPTGALDHRMWSKSDQPDRTVRTTCGYCGVGCQFDLNVKDHRIAGVTSTPDAPVNGRSLCVKGRYGFDFVHHADRLLRPRVRRYLLDGIPSAERPSDRGPWVEVSWEDALTIIAGRFVQIRNESGPQAFGVLSSAKCTNEENYLMQKFARQVLGTNNVDHCARLCHSSTVAGLAMAMGSGAMSNSMDDIAHKAKAILIIGSNTTEQHRCLGQCCAKPPCEAQPSSSPTRGRSIWSNSRSSTCVSARHRRCIGQRDDAPSNRKSLGRRIVRCQAVRGL